MPEGSWKCEKCNNINYPFRTKCNRQNCGVDKPAETKKPDSPTGEENDQVCFVMSVFVCCLQLLFLPIAFVCCTNSIMTQLYRLSVPKGFSVKVAFFPGSVSLLFYSSLINFGMHHVIFHVFLFSLSLPLIGNCLLFQ